MNLFFGGGAGQEDDAPLMPESHTEFIAYLQNYLRQKYVPVQQYKEAAFTRTTKQIFDALQTLFPSDWYSPSEVATWMREAGFKFEDVGEMRYEWLMKESG